MAFADYEADKGKLKDFLQNFCVTSKTFGGGQSKEFKYAKRLQKLAHREEVEIVIELDDLEAHDDENETLVESIEKNAKRYTQLVSEAVTELIPEFRTREAVAKDSLDIYIEHRLASARAFEAQMHGQDQEAAARPSVESQFPPDLLRRFEVYWKPRSVIKPLVLRALRADQIGKLVTVHGVAIRASEVRPLLSVATYSCDSCSAETFQPIGGPSFTPIVIAIRNFVNLTELVDDFSCKHEDQNLSGFKS